MENIFMKLPAEKIITALTTEELIETARNQFNPIAHQINFSDIEVTDEFQLRVPGQIAKWQHQPMTETALKTFCSVLGIPNPFARKIPEDLLLYNIRRLLTEQPTKEVTLVNDYSQNMVVGFTKTSPEKLVHPHVVLDHLPIAANYKAHFVLHGDSFLRIDLLNDNWPKIELEKGDITATGISIDANFLSPLTTARLFLMQLICTNGAQAPRSFGQMTCFGGGERKLENFFMKLEDQFGQMQILQEAYHHLKNTEMDTDRFRYYWDTVNRILQDDNETDNVFDVDAAQREDYKERAKIEKKNARDLLRDPEYSLTPLVFYDTYYNITRYAQNTRVIDRRELTKLAGRMLLEYKRN